MKSNLKWFFKITTIISYLKITPKFKKKGLLESDKGKVISNSSFMLSNFLCVARNLEKKNLFLETKMTKYLLQFIYTGLHFMVFICFQSVLKVIEMWYIRLVIVVGAVITYKIFDTGTKHLSATDGQLKFFLGPCG